MRDNRGFTLIELMVVLGLAGIVISVVMSFLIANYKSYQVINTESEVQYQSQYIINYITNKILEAEAFEGKTGSQYIFKYSDGKIASFEIEGKKIKYIYNSNDVLIGNYVKELNIGSSGTGEVKITLVLEKGKDQSYSAEQVAFMRNSK